MNDWLRAMWDLYTQFAKESPVVASVVSVSGMGIATFFLRTVPSTCWRFIQRQSTTTLTFDNSATGPSRELFLNAMTWYDKSPMAKYGRTLRVYGGWGIQETSSKYGSTQWGPVIRIGFGDGVQIGIWEGMPVWLRRSRMSGEDTQNSEILYEISITRLGRNREALRRLLKFFEPAPRSQRQSVMQFKPNERWSESSVLRARALDSVVLPESTKSTLLSAIDKFVGSEEWYVERGIPYKLCILLRGTPGCGKTSLIRALASYFERDLYLAQLNDLTDETLREAFSSSGSRGFLVLEDFNISALRARTPQLTVPMTAASKSQDTAPRQIIADCSSNGITDIYAAQYLPEKPTAVPTAAQKENKEFLLDGFGVSLQGFLNVLDGLEDIHGKIIFLTTNIYEELDAAVVRKGRVDLTLELSELEVPEIQRYLERVFPNALPRIHAWMFHNLPAPISGADLQALYIEHSENLEALLAALPSIRRESMDPQNASGRSRSSVPSNAAVEDSIEFQPCTITS